MKNEILENIEKESTDVTISTPIQSNTLEKIDEIAQKTKRTRADIISKCLEYGLYHLPIAPLFSSEDELYEVAKFVIQHQHASINLIQTAFGFGFNKSSQIINKLEELKILSAKQGVHGRSILVDESELDKIIRIYKENNEVL